MSVNERLLWAVGVFSVDLLIFFVPVTALAAVYVILARPPWFKEWMARLYA